MSAHPVPVVLARLYELAKDRAAELEVPDDPESVIRVDVGDPGDFEEYAALSLGLGTTPVDPAETRDTPRTPRREDHIFDLVCVALAWTGDDPTPEQRLAAATRAHALVDMLAAEIDDPQRRHLGLVRVVEQVGIDRSSFAWRDDEGSSGTTAIVEFTVRVVAYRPRPIPR